MIAMKLKRFLATVLSTVVIFNTVSEPLVSYAAESTDKSESKTEFEKMIYEDGLKRFLATVLSTVVIFNTVSEPLVSYAAESTDKSESKTEFEKMIYEDGITFEECVNALLDDKGFYDHYIQLTDPEKSQFLNLFGKEEQYQIKQIAKYSFVNELIQSKGNPDLESVEGIIAHAQTYASLPTHNLKNHQELDKKVSEYFSKYHNKKFNSLVSYEEYLQSIASFDVNIILKHLDNISSMQKNEEKLQEYILKFRSYVLSIYGFDESEAGLPSEYIPEMTEEQRQGLLKEEEEFSKAEEAKRNQEVSMNTEENGSEKENADKPEEMTEEQRQGLLKEEEEFSKAEEAKRNQEVSMNTEENGSEKENADKPEVPEESKEDSKVEDASTPNENANEEETSISEGTTSEKSTEDNLSNIQESENIEDQKEIQNEPAEDIVEESTEDDRLLEKDAEMVDESTVSTYAAQTRAINKVIFNNSPQLPVDNYFAPRWINGKTKVKYPYTPSGAFFVKDTTSGTVELLDKNSLSSGTSYKLKDSDKGKIKVEYTNVGSFNGKTVDMRITAMDWKNPARIQFGDTRLGCGNSSFKEGGDQRYIRFKVEYFVGGTKNLVPGLKGHQLLNDMDWIKGPELWQGALNCSSTVYMTSKDSNYLRIDRDFVTVSKKSGGSGTEDGADFIYLFNDNTHEFKWYGGFCGMSSVDCPAQEFVIKYMPNGGSGYMSPTRVKVGHNTKTSNSQFTRAGYVQNGWRVFRDYDSKWATMDSAWWTGNSYNEANRIYTDGCYVSNTAPCGTVYFYANWVKQHQLAFDTQGGNIKPGIIRNGVYRIQYSGDSSKAIHLVNKSYTTGVATNIWTGTGSAFNTNWHFERYKDTDYYYIMNAGNSLYLKSSGTHNGTPSLQRLTSTTSNKDPYLWRVVREGSYYSFVNKSSGYALDLYDGNTANGTKIVEHSVNHTTAQKWNLLSTDTTRDYPTKNKLQGFELWIPDSVPVKSGARFLGWNTDPNGYGTMYQPGANYTPDQAGGTVTLYAQWQQTAPADKHYTVRYHSNNGYGNMSDSRHKVNEYSYLSRNQFYRSGYKFLGWSKNSYATRATYSDGEQIYNLSTTDGAVIDLYAIWEKESTGGGQYTVVYMGNGNDGGYTPSSTHTIGQWKNLSTNGYYKNGYTFSGWSYSSNGNISYRDGEYVGDLSTTPGATVYLYAQWTKVSSGSYYVHYDSNGGSGTMYNSSHKIDEYSYLSSNQFYRNGYRFLGWSKNKYDARPTYYDSERIYNLTTINGSTVTLYAIWESTGPTSHTVTYKPNGGNGSDQYQTVNNGNSWYARGAIFSRQTVNNGNSWYARGAIFSRSGYTLDSWNTDPYGNGTKYGLDLYQDPLYSDLTLYAQWKANPVSKTYTVRYNGNGADGGYTPNSTHTIGQYGYLNDNAFYRNGYVFKGWATYSFGSAVFGNKAYVKDLTTTPGAIVDLYAVWEQEAPSAYTITYKPNGGTGAEQTQIVSAGSGWYARGTIFTRNDYILESWNTDPNGRITYKPNGGTGAEQTQIVSAGSGWYARGTIFTRNDYILESWNTDPNGRGTRYELDGWHSSLNSNLTLYAQWKQKAPSGQYKVVYLGNGADGGSTESSVHTIGLWSYLSYNGFYRNGYEFQGWSTTSTGEVSYKDHEYVGNLTTTPGSTIYLYAVWKYNGPTHHTVTYKSNGGSGSDQTQIVNIGNGWYARGEIFTRTNYTLESWNTDPSGRGTRYELNGWHSSLDSNLTLYAQWKLNAPKTYTVHYHNNGGTGFMDDDTFTINEYGYLSLNQFKKDGYAFVGWSTNQYATNPMYYDGQRIFNMSTVDGDVITLYAIWEYVAPNAYSITYKPNGGSGSDHVQEVQVGQSWYARGNIFTRVDYTLESWNTDPNGRGTRYELDGWHSSLNGNLTLYAQWKQKEKKQYIVQYIANNGTSISDIEQTVLDGEYWMTQGNIFTKDGYTLESWNTSQTGYGVRYELSQMQDPITADLTLYAQYKPNKYTVNYHGNGETSGSTTSSVHEFDKPQNLTPNGFKKDGYIFEGWTTIPPVATTYTVKYNGNGADAGKMADSIFTIGKNEQLSKNLYSKTGYKFIGWSTDSKATVATYNDESIVSNLAGKGGTITLYAIWQRIQPTSYTVTYKSNGGIGTDYVQSVLAGQSWTSNGNIFTKSGYTLKSWNTREDGRGTTYELNAWHSSLNKNLTLYAQWEKVQNRYKVTYLSNRGIPQSSLSQYVNENESWTTKGNVFGSAEIKSWNTEANGSGVRYETNTVQLPLKQDLTLYAQWEDVSNDKYVLAQEHGISHSIIPEDVTKVTFTDETPPTYVSEKNVSKDSDGYLRGWYVPGTKEYKISSCKAGKKVFLNPDSRCLFGWKNNLTEIDFTNADTSLVTSMSNMFSSCRSIKNLDLSNFNTSNVTTMAGMFDYMTGLTELDLSSFDTSKLTVTRGMFNSMINLKTIYVSDKWNATTFVDTLDMFMDCRSLIGQSGQTYDPNYTRDQYANYQNGYLTYKAAPRIMNASSYAIDKNASTYALKDFYQDEEEVVNLTNVNNGVVDMYAVWRLEEYTVTYKPNGGLGTDQVQKVQPSKGWYTKDAIFSKEGYTLESWNTDPNGKGDRYGLNSFSFTLDKDLVLYAQWKKDEAIEGYTVTYKPNGGNGSDFVETIPYDSYFTPQGPIFTRDKFEQISWNTSPNGDGEQYDFYTTYPKLTGNLILYAQWKEESTEQPHTVTYKPNGGSGTDHIQYVDAGSGWYLRGAIFNKTDHTLESWNTRADGQGTRYELDAFEDSLNEDLVLYAQWRNNNLEEHRVTYKPNGGSGNDHVQTVPGGAAWYTRGMIFSKPGYVLSSWNTSENGQGTRYELDALQMSIDTDLILYAQWEKEEVYGIYFSRLPSAILSSDQSKWSSDAELLSVNENDHIVKYKVWYDKDSNNFMPNTWSNVIDDYQKTDVTLDMLINNIPVQPYDQYVHFAGQTAHGDSIADLVLIPAIYKVTYKANDTSIPDQTQPVMKNESWIVKNNIFAKPGYTLESWNTKPDGSGTKYELGSVQPALDGNLTLHAQWKAIPTAPTITIGDQTKTFYEGTTVTKENLLKNVSANDKIEGDITNKLEVVKIEYAAGRLVGNKHQSAYVEEWPDGMQENDTLDTWFMELDKNLSPIEHKVTFKVTNNSGLSSTAVQSVFVKYNEFPEIKATDRYFTLEEAQSGVITDKLLREDAIKDGKLSATDVEEGDFSTTSKITLVDFDAEEFKNFTDSGYRKLTFHVQDTYGPNGKGKETLCQITVYVMKDGEIVEPEKGKAIRFIDEKYYNLNKDCDPDTMTEAEKEKANKNGGLNVESKWYRDPEYRALLQSTFGKTSGTRYHYTLEDLNAMRSFVDIHGPGNAQEIDALSKFADQFMTGKYKQ